VPVFAGQSLVSDTAVGSPLEIEIGRAVDVHAEYRVTDSEKYGSGGKERTRKSFVVTVANHKPVPVRFEARQPMVDRGMEIISESRAHIVKSGSFAWDFDVAPDSSATLAYTLEYPGG